MIFCGVYKGSPSMAPMWCGNCARYIRKTDTVEGKTCCALCGKVLFEDNFTEDCTFVKGSSGESKLAGNFVRSVQSDQSLSRQRTLQDAQYDIENMVYALGIDGGDSIVRPSVAFYTIALERNFTRGRRKEQVEAACLYIACRESKKPYLLIDFSEHLRINVYVLGAVFLQLCKLLSLEEHPIVQKPVDPSLFIHKFTDRLFGGRKPSISRTALQIVASMKRDWMQTGRKPSGLCGAALYISALSHGHHCTKTEIIRIVHICEGTLTKRLIEFENTASGAMTIEEFNNKAEELEREERLKISADAGRSGINKALCGHGNGETPFAHGLCRRCYEEFIQLSGGLDGGSEPPAFQRAEMMRAKEVEDEILRGGNFIDTTELEAVCTINENAHDSSNERVDGADAAFIESESLSDIDDSDIDFYIHNEEEKQLKKIIWEEINKEYLEEQAAKEAAELAAKKAYEENLSNCPEDVLESQKLYAAALAKLKKDRQLKRASEVKNTGPPQTAFEATKQILEKKRLSSKVRFDVLEKLFEEAETFESATKKSRSDPEHATEPELNQDAGYGYDKGEMDIGNNQERVEEYGYTGDYNLFDDL